MHISFYIIGYPLTSSHLRGFHGCLWRVGTHEGGHSLPASGYDPVVAPTEAAVHAQFPTLTQPLWLAIEFPPSCFVCDRCVSRFTRFRYARRFAGSQSSSVTRVTCTSAIHGTAFLGFSIVRKFEAFYGNRSFSAVKSTVFWIVTLCSSGRVLRFGGI
jgi:hypothetical protein